MKTPKKISTNRSRRTSQSEGSVGKTFTQPDNDGDIVNKTQEAIDTAQHGNVLGDDPEQVEQELANQKTEEELKKERIRQKELEDAIINSTQKQSDAISKTIAEIMYGPVAEEKPVRKKEGKK
jgi:hypothetical protein